MHGLKRELNDGGGILDTARRRLPPFLMKDFAEHSAPVHLPDLGDDLPLVIAATDR